MKLNTIFMTIFSIQFKYALRHHVNVLREKHYYMETNKKHTKQQQKQGNLLIWIVMRCGMRRARKYGLTQWSAQMLQSAPHSQHCTYTQSIPISWHHLPPPCTLPFPLLFLIHLLAQFMCTWDYLYFYVWYSA